MRWILSVDDYEHEIDGLNDPRILIPSARVRVGRVLSPLHHRFTLQCMDVRTNQHFGNDEVKTGWPSITIFLIRFDIFLSASSPDSHNTMLQGPQVKPPVTSLTIPTKITAKMIMSLDPRAHYIRSYMHQAQTVQGFEFSQ